MSLEKQRERQRRYRSSHLESERERERRYRIENPEKVRASKQRWRSENPEKVREQARRYDLKSKYGISLEEYDQMLTDQGGGCAICGRTCNGNGKALFVDHCHGSGKVRGILCAYCNTGVGWYEAQGADAIGDYLS